MNESDLSRPPEGTRSSPSASTRSQPSRSEDRPSYEPPVLEPLGQWSALTLQQTVPISILPGLRGLRRLG